MARFLGPRCLTLEPGAFCLASRTSNLVPPHRWGGDPHLAMLYVLTSQQMGAQNRGPQNWWTNPNEAMVSRKYPTTWPNGQNMPSIFCPWIRSECGHSCSWKNVEKNLARQLLDGSGAPDPPWERGIDRLFEATIRCKDFTHTNSWCLKTPEQSCKILAYRSKLFNRLKGRLGMARLWRAPQSWEAVWPVALMNLSDAG